MTGRTSKNLYLFPIILSLFFFSCSKIDKTEITIGIGWEQYKGKNLTIHFISENTPPSSSIAALADKFYDLTGIRVIVEQLKLDDMVQKVALDFSSRTGNYEAIYVDPYQVLAPFYESLVDLNSFISDTTLPELPNGLGDFIPTQIEAAGWMISPDKLYSLPYDTPTIIWIYRTDIFNKYKEQFKKDEGFDWTPGANLSWEQYYIIARWINDHVPDSEAKYGTGHQAKQHDALTCDFSNVLWSYGGDYFATGDRKGILNPGKCSLTSEASIKAAEFYKKLIDIAHPGSVSWDWNGLAEAFAAGEIAMAPEWHEHAGMFADPQRSKVAGKVGFALLPHGPSGKSINMWGGSGIGINKFASQEKQRAAWMFLVWATSAEVQLETLMKVGGTPTRLSVYDIPDMKKAMYGPSNLPVMLAGPAVLEAWKEEHIGLRPKTPYWLKINNVIFTQLSTMLAGNKTPQQAMQDAAKQIDEITGNL